MVNPKITPEILLNAYASGIFPMAPTARSRSVHWLEPEQRGIMPLDDGFHISKSLRRFLNKKPFTVTINQAFDAIIAACGDTRDESWINPSIHRWMRDLHRLGFAHSVECWHADGRLAGGLYGVAIRGAFFGESMVSFSEGASKVALVHLVARLRSYGFTLLDCQFVNPYLQQFGCTEISRDEYQSRLSVALSSTAVPSFASGDTVLSLAAGASGFAGSSGFTFGSIQSITQTS